MHTLKKTLNVYSASNSTKDPEYDRLYAEFKIIPKSCEDVRKALLQFKGTWETQQKNRQSLTQAILNATTRDSRGHNLAKDYKSDGECFHRGSMDVQDKLSNGMTLLEKFTASVKKCSSICDKRAAAIKDYDYYRGKHESLEKKNESYTKISTARTQADTAEVEYERANEEAIHAMNAISEIKDDIFFKACLALIDHEYCHYNLEQPPFLSLMNGVDERTLNETWIYDEPDFYVPASARRESRRSPNVSRSPSRESRPRPTPTPQSRPAPRSREPSPPPYDSGEKLPTRPSSNTTPPPRPAPSSSRPPVPSRPSVPARPAQRY